MQCLFLAILRMTTVSTISNSNEWPSYLYDIIISLQLQDLNTTTHGINDSDHKSHNFEGLAGGSMWSNKSIGKSSKKLSLLLNLSMLSIVSILQLPGGSKKGNPMGCCRPIPNSDTSSRAQKSSMKHGSSILAKPSRLSIGNVRSFWSSGIWGKDICWFCSLILQLSKRVESCPIWIGSEELGKSDFMRSGKDTILITSEFWIKGSENDWGFDDDSPSDDELNFGAYTSQQICVIPM